MIDVDRLQRHLEERARIASVEASPITGIVRPRGSVTGGGEQRSE